MSESVLWNEMGNLHMKMGAFEEAISSYGKAIELSPKFGQAYCNLGLAYYCKGKYEDAISFFQKSLDISDSNKEQSIAWKRIGDAHQKLGSYEKAMSAYKMGDELDSIQEVNFSKAVVYPVEDVLTQLNPVGETGEVDPFLASSKNSPDNTDDLNQIEQAIEADADAAENELDDSGQIEFKHVVTPPFLPDTLIDEKLALEVCQIQPESPEPDLVSIPDTAHTDEGEFRELNNWLQTLDTDSVRVEADHQGRDSDIRTINDIVPSSPCDTQLALVRTNTTKPEPQFSEHVNQWAPLEPLNTTSLGQNSDLEKRSSPQAVLELEPNSRMELFKSWKLSEEPEHNTDIWKNMIEVLEKNQTSQQTVPELSDQSKSNIMDFLTPEDQPLEKKIINRELFESIENYRKITNVAPTNDKAWDTLGKLLKDAGEYGEAVEAFEQAISISPNKDLYYYHLGLVYAAQKRHDDAINAFQKVIDLNPGYILAHCALAGSYRRLGRDIEAEEHIKVALPRLEAETEYNRACFEAICGNTDQAIELLKLALEKKQTSPEWVRGDPDLDFIRDDPRFKALVGS